MSKTNIVILGCPRSGTSLVAQLVKSAGYDADGNGTKELMKPNPKYNPDGYFERLDIVKMNDKILQDVYRNSNFLNPPRLQLIIEDPVDLFDEMCNPDFYELNKELDSQKNPFFLKDSRLCFTLQHYAFKYRIIKVVRNKEDVKKSMINHYGNIFKEKLKHGPHIIQPIPFDYYYSTVNLFIDYHINDLLRRLLYKNAFIEVSYEDLIQGKVEELEKFLEAPVDKSIIKPQYRNYGTM